MKATAKFNMNWTKHQVSSQVRWVELSGEFNDVRSTVLAMLDTFYPLQWEPPKKDESPSFKQYTHEDAVLGAYVLASIHIETESAVTT